MNPDVLKTLTALGVDIDKNTIDIQKNANEVANTGDDASGGSAVPDEVLAKEIFDTIPEYSTFLKSLPGFHGNNLDMTQNVPIIGDVGLFHSGSEQTTGALAVAQGNTVAPIGEVVLSQKKYFMTLDVSDELSRFNVLGPEGFKSKLLEKLGKAAARTIEAVIINGDTEAGATGNVNVDDDTPAAGDLAYDHYLQTDGLRKTAIVTDTNTVNVGTLEVADMTAAMAKIGDFAADPSECIWLFNRATYTKALGVSDFSDASKSGKESTISGKAITNVFGSDLFIARDVAKTEADGKISDTPGNNTLGQFLYLWKPCIQYGFNQELKLKLYDLGKDGYQLQGWFYMGFAIISKKASVTDPSVVAGINVTV